MDQATHLIPLDRLVPSKPPETQPESVDVAIQRMAEAAEGRRERRPPILVTPTWEIVDGNATYGAALQAGWPDLPVAVTD